MSAAFALDSGGVVDAPEPKRQEVVTLSTPEPFITDPDFTLYVGDAREIVAALPAESIDCCVTSPPYLGLRDYGADGQIGREASIGEYVEALVALFSEVHRVLRPSGTLWLNLGDSYNAYNGNSGPGSSIDGPGKVRNTQRPQLASGHGLQQKELKPKDLMMVPARVALALQAAGWWLRSDIVWSKPNPMPESVQDRPTKAHEYIYLLTKSERYFYDADAIAEPASWEKLGGAYSPPGQAPHSNARKADETPRNDGERWNENGGRGFVPTKDTRNARTVWTIATQPYPEAHFATFPIELPRRCIAAGTSEHGVCPDCGAPFVRRIMATAPDGRRAELENGRTGVGEDGKPLMGDNMIDPGVRGSFNSGHATLKRETIGWKPTCAHGKPPAAATVLDPFGGSGTTALAARGLGRRSVLVELNEEYAQLAARRLSQLSLLAEEVV